MSPVRPNLRQAALRHSNGVALGLIALGTAVLLGWALDIPFLKSLRPNFLALFVLATSLALTLLLWRKVRWLEAAQQAAAKLEQQARQWEAEAAAQRIAHDTAERLAAIVKDTDDAIISVTLNGIVTSWNRAAERIYGYTAAEAIGHHITITVPPDRREEPKQILAKIARGERVSHFETVRQRKDGTCFNVSLMISPITDAAGKVVGASGIVRDITEHKRLQQQKDEFVSILSHEIRNPLTAIKGALSNLRVGVPGSASPAQTESIGLALRNMERIEKFLAALLDLHRRETRQLPFARRCVDPRAILHEAVASFQQVAMAKHITLLEEAPATVPSILADPDQLAEVLYNLVNNALRFAKRRIVAHIVAVDNAVQISVIDDGPGIAKEHHAAIFNKFTRLPQPEESPHEGTGLGLAICHEIIAQHEGRIWVESDPGHGARFLFTLPIDNGP